MISTVLAHQKNIYPTQVVVAPGTDLDAFTLGDDAHILHTHQEVPAIAEPDRSGRALNVEINVGQVEVVYEAIFDDRPVIRTRAIILDIQIADRGVPHSANVHPPIAVQG